MPKSLTFRLWLRHAERDLPLRRHDTFARFEHSNLAIGEISEPHSPLRILCEESNHLNPGREREFRKLSGRGIKSGNVGAKIVRQPQASGLLINYDSVRAEIPCWWLEECHLLGLCIDPTESVAQDIAEPDVVLRVHFNAPHKCSARHLVPFDLACLGIHSINRALGTVCTLGILVRIDSQGRSSNIVGVKLLRFGIETEGFFTSGRPNVAN